MRETSEGRVTVIIPARNEEATVERAVRSLAAQRGVLEILVVDDQSQDRTREVLEGLKSEVETLRVISLAALPPGWTGKSYAIASAARQAAGDWLLLTDADVEHLPGSLDSLLGRAERERADMLSLSPGQATPTVWEKAVIPLTYTRLARLFRFEDVSDPDSPQAAANGQYILIRREVYERAGGHEAVRGAILEDVELARCVKTAGGRLLFMPGAEWASTRMYRSFRSMWRGWTKNLYLLYGRRVGRIMLTVAELWVLDVLPALAFIVLCLGLATGRTPPWSALAATGCFLAVLLRQWAYVRDLARLGFEPSLGNYRVPGAALLGLLLLSSVYAHRLGGAVEWKGREYSTRGKP